jgi:hypothetical protein
VYNIVNLRLYPYAGNNPVKYTELDGETLVKPNGALGTFAHYAILGNLRPILGNKGLAALQQTYQNEINAMAREMGLNK